MIGSLFQPPPQTPRASAGLLALRLFAGYAFMVHGYGKIQHPFSWAGPDATIPGFFLALAALSEFGGGLAWMLGLLTPLASFGLTCTMAVAAWMHLSVMKQPLIAKDANGSAEPAAAYLCVAVLLLLAGPGRWSVDALLFRPRNK
jgi:putative oxidoreductase